MSSRTSLTDEGPDMYESGSLLEKQEYDSDEHSFTTSPRSSTSLRAGLLGHSPRAFVTRVKNRLPKSYRPASRRHLVLYFVLPSLGLIVVLLSLSHWRKLSIENEHEVYRETAEEVSGSGKPRLLDLGEEAERAYDSMGHVDRTSYYDALKHFIDEGLPSQSHSIFHSSLEHYFSPIASRDHSPAMVDYRYIHQTDKTEDGGELTQSWRDQNPTHELLFYDDAAAERFVEEHAGGSRIEWAYKDLRRGVLKADFFRYLAVLFKGGVYSDVDTADHRPIDEWGKIEPQIFDLSAVESGDWQSHLRDEPSVIIGVDVDVHELTGWHQWWPRPLGICQWTLSGAPHHPIYLDVARRVVNATEYVDHYVHYDLEKQLKELELDVQRSNGDLIAWTSEIERLKKLQENRVGILPVMDHTGPGVWSDAVLSYLKARYDVSWHDLRGLERPLRIGDVLILPITGFSPGGQPDFHAQSRDDPQACVLHDFRGSWKGDGY